MSGGVPVAQSYADELREIAGMLAQTLDGPVRWKQYRLVAIADFLSSLAHTPAAPALLAADNHFCGTHSEGGTVHKQIRAAIAKARGGAA